MRKEHAAAAPIEVSPVAPLALVPGDVPFKIPGYRVIARIHQSWRADIYRGVRERDDQPVVLKALHGHTLTPENVASYRHEYQMLLRLQSEGVIRAFDFKEDHSVVALIIEDFGGKALRERMAKSPLAVGLDQQLELALKLVAALRDVHAADIIHKDINPNNIVINATTGALKIIDFGLATPLQREQATTAIPTTLLGTLAYIAPEQTGRMNRAVDYRSDFYSLGATLYEFFAGQVPFAGNDALELIHAHIARQPTPPHVVNPKVPEPVSAIIMKLLAKTAEERYQSIWSVEADLENCLNQWRATGTVEPFPIDRSIIHDRFQLPQKLYGREKELAELLTAFESASNGRSEILFVTGHSGIGKTSLVREVYKPITAKRGYFVSGKFDQFQRNIPFGAVLAAMAELVRQLLSEREDQIAHWKDAFQETLGSNGRVLTDLLPDLQLIIGEQPPVPTLGPSQTQERLALALRRFFGVVCRAKHPLVLYLDDLQWADGASLKLLVQLLPYADIKYLLVIAAYRSNEVDATHPAATTRAQLFKLGVTINEIALAPLAVGHIEQLLVDAFHVGHDRATPLAALVHEKTGGNAYFVDEFLKSLHAKGMLYFDRPARRWSWDVDKINALDVTTNVGELMTQNIRELNAAAQRFLPLAACLGNPFDIRTLALVAAQPAQEVTNELDEAVVRGLILPVGGNYRRSAMADTDAPANVRFRFAHDRVQQAAYELIVEQDRARAHYRIGQLLLGAANPAEPAKNRFQIVNHLNLGKNEALPAERKQLAEINLAAGRQAKATAVFEAAFVYFETGIELLGPSAWDEHYDLALALNNEAAQAAALCAKYPEFQRRFDLIREKARKVLDVIAVFDAKIGVETRRADFRAAVDTGLEALRLLGVRYPRKVTVFHDFYYALRARLAGSNWAIDRLVNRPKMSDPIRIAATSIMRSLILVFFWLNSPYRAMNLYRLFHMCAKYGNPTFAPIIYAAYGIFLASGPDRPKGYRLSRVAMALLDKLNAEAQRPTVTYMATSLVHWKDHCRDTLPIYLENHRLEVELGELQYAGHSLLSHSYTAFHAGENLPSLHTTLQTSVESLIEKRSVDIVTAYRDLTAYLSGHAADAGILAEPETAAAAQKPEKVGTFTSYFCQLFLAFHFGEYARAWRYMQLATPMAHTVQQLLRYSDLYMGLVRVMQHPALSEPEQPRNKREIGKVRDRLKIFTRHCPENYLNKWQLLEAEYARLQGKYNRAEKYYDAAIASAQQGGLGFIQEEALANELAGRHYLARNRIRVAQAYMREARALYTRWGAAKKVRWLDDTYPQLQLAVGSRATSTDGTVGTATIAPMSLDLPALMKALKAIAEETVHSHILQRTIEIVMQFAGADKALLLLRSEDDLRVEADMDTSRKEVELLKSVSIQNSTRLCQAVANYAKRTKASVVIHDAQEPQSVVPGLQNDAYIRDNRVRSILCIPITVGAGPEAEVIGLLYIENNQSSYAFTEQRVETLEIICLSVAGRLELSRKAVTDSLTGLYNRGHFQMTLAKELSLARRKERPVSLLLIDIDHFKKVNDECGHQVGDEVIKHVARTIKESCRETDVVARYGGEEMVVILTETSIEQATVVAERIRRTLEEQPLHHGDRVVKATASLGVAVNDGQRKEPESLIKAADDALYRSKANGRNRVTIA